MPTDLVTVLVVATLVVLAVLMARQRGAIINFRHQHDSSQLWKPPAPAPGPAPIPTPLPPPKDPDAAGQEVMQHLKRLDELSPGLLHQVIPVFLKDSAARLEALRAAINEHNGATAHRIAHTLHGSAATVGSASMVRACAEIIREVRLGAFDGCGQRIDDLDQDFESIRRAAVALPPQDER